MPRPKRPHIVKRLIRGKVRFVVDLGRIAGKRVERFFRTRAEAQIYLEEQKQKLQEHGERAVALSEADRVLFQFVRDGLASRGKTLMEAFDFFLAHSKPLKAPIALRELLEKCVLDKELGGARKRYLQTFACSCRSFGAGRMEQLAHTITREQVKEWITKKGFSPKTQRNYLGDLRECLAWGMREGYLQENPIAGEDGFIPLEAEADEEIEAFGLEQCVALLKAALLGVHQAHGRAGTGRWVPVAQAGGYRPLLGYLALALFAGVRPEEIARTPLGKLNLRQRTVVIMAKSAKTRQRRVLELSRPAVAWLRLWRRLCPGAEALVPKNFVRLWKALRKEALPGAPWPHDALRHTFATYHFAAYQDVKGLQAQLGHSEREDTLFRHYRAVETLGGKTVTRKMGEEFWRLTPRRVRLWQL